MAGNILEMYKSGVFFLSIFCKCIVQVKVTVDLILSWQNSFLIRYAHTFNGNLV